MITNGIHFNELNPATTTADNDLFVIWDSARGEARVITIEQFKQANTIQVGGTPLSANWDAGDHFIRLAGIQARTGRALRLVDDNQQGITIQNGKVTLTGTVTDFDIGAAKITGTNSTVNLGAISAASDAITINQAATMNVATIKGNAPGGDLRLYGGRSSSGIVVTGGGDVHMASQSTHLKNGRIFNPDRNPAHWPADITNIPESDRPPADSVRFTHRDHPDDGYTQTAEGDLTLKAETNMTFVTDGSFLFRRHATDDTGNHQSLIHIDTEGNMTLSGKALRLDFDAPAGSTVSNQLIRDPNSPSFELDKSGGAATKYKIDITQSSPDNFIAGPGLQMYGSGGGARGGGGIMIIANTTGDVAFSPRRRRDLSKANLDGGKFANYDEDTGTWQADKKANLMDQAMRLGDAATLGSFRRPWDIIFCHSSQGIVVQSSSEVKEDIRDTEHGLDFINALRPVDYVHMGSATQEHGFIAEELEELGFFGHHRDEDGMHWVAPYNFIGPIVRAIQELSARL